MLKLGKTPARIGAVKLKFSDFLTTAKPPKAPARFGHEGVISDWQMLGNDNFGCCVWSGAAHETMMWNKVAGRDVAFNPDCVLSDYSAVTGFNPKDPNTDQGTDMELAAKYRRTTGVVDASGTRHLVGAYLDLTPGDLQQHLLAAYMFGAVGIGIEFPTSAMDQFNAGKPWSVARGSRVDGGHYIPFIAKRANIMVVTWGKCQQMTPGFFKKYNDESVVYLSEEMLVNGKSVEGFDLAALQQELAVITKK